MPHRKRAAHPDQTSFAAVLFASDNTPDNSPQAATIHETSVGLFAAYAPVYTVKLVQTGAVGLREVPVISSPQKAVELITKHLDGVDREHFLVLMLDTKNRLLGVNTVSIGDLSSAIVHPREVFKPAILANSAVVLLAHNHPSGNPEPSPEDIAVTNRLAEAGGVLGIEVLDHVIIGSNGLYISLREKGLFAPITLPSNYIGEQQRAALVP